MGRSLHAGPSHPCGVVYKAGSAKRVHQFRKQQEVSAELALRQLVGALTPRCGPLSSANTGLNSSTSLPRGRRRLSSLLASFGLGGSILVRPLVGLAFCGRESAESLQLRLFSGSGESYDTLCPVHATLLSKTCILEQAASYSTIVPYTCLDMWLRLIRLHLMYLVLCVCVQFGAAGPAHAFRLRLWPFQRWPSAFER